MNDEMDLPCDHSAEQFILAALLTDESSHPEIFSQIRANDFSLQKHQVIFGAAQKLHESNQPIGRGTVATALQSAGELQNVGGISSLIELDDCIPKVVVLKHFIRIVLEKSTLRKMWVSHQQATARIVTGHETGAEILRDFQDQMAQLKLAMPADGIQSTADIMAEIGLDEIVNSRRKGISTGFSKVDSLLGGLHAGDLVIIAGRPAMGKSALAMNIATKLAFANHRVAVISLEMSKISLLHRMIYSEARIPGNEKEFANLTREERNRIHACASRLTEPQLYIMDRNSMNVNEIVDECHKLKLKHGLDVVVVDYLQLISGEMRRDQNRTLQVGEQARALKTAAKDLNVSIIALSQLSRACETRPGHHRPILSDLRDSGELEQHADTVGFLYRGEVYDPSNTELAGRAELIIAKQRNGPIGWIPLTFLSHLAKFENATEEQ